MKSTTSAANAKHNWTAFELLMLAPFGLLLWYVGTQPLVLPAAPAAAVIASAAAAEVPVEPAAAAPVTVADPDAPVFVTAGTTVLQRIAPVARVTLEAQETAALTQAETADAPVVDAQPVAAAVSTGVEPAAASTHIEITDATGVEGFAGELVSQLEKAGVTVSKTANVAAGVQRRTVILFRDGFEEDAVRLSKLFAHPPALVNNTRSRKASDSSDLRLVLGSAAAREKALLASKGGAASM